MKATWGSAAGSEDVACRPTARRAWKLRNIVAVLNRHPPSICIRPAVQVEHNHLTGTIPPELGSLQLVGCCCLVLPFAARCAQCPGEAHPAQGDIIPQPRQQMHPPHSATVAPALPAAAACLPFGPPPHSCLQNWLRFADNKFVGIIPKEYSNLTPELYQLTLVGAAQSHSRLELLALAAGRRSTCRVQAHCRHGRHGCPTSQDAMTLATQCRGQRPPKPCRMTTGWTATRASAATCTRCPA